jgi:hypothetical protein
MFFIGGFNSFIPYVVYLSLVWVFIVIGFHGKANQAWNWVTQKTHTRVPENSQQIDNQIIHIYDIAADHAPSVEQTALAPADSPPLPHDPAIGNCNLSIAPAVKIFHNGSCLFRGPPRIS